MVKHYQDNDGKLRIWGIIRKYWFYHGEEDAIAFSPDGALLEEGKYVSEQCASVTINGKNLLTILSNT